MHPLVAYDLAKIKIDESHRQAERERRFRMAVEANRDAEGARYPDAGSRISVRARLATALTLGGLLR